LTGIEFEIIRDPLWNNIRVDPVAMRLVDTPAFQRLRYVKQLGLAHLVYPGAIHSRFEHALGTYHLAGRTLTLLAERGELTELAADEPRIVRYAALLHDIGHYPFSHALEEIGAIRHEDVAGALLTAGPIGAVLTEELGVGAPESVHDLVVGSSGSALQGLISGSLDLDKIEYLKRDAFMCGVPYGEIDVDRLTNSMVILRDPIHGGRALGVAEKALSALESLLFAKYQMYRNVYWHHAVRSATAMYKRLVEDALGSGAVDGQCLHSYTDEGLLHQLEKTKHPLLADLRARRLYKRAFERPSTEIDVTAVDRLVEDRDRLRAIEDALAAASGVGRGMLLIDFPAKTEMLGLDILVVRRNGDVQRLTAAGWREAINLPRLADELYRSTRWLRVYTRERTSLAADTVLAALSLLIPVWGVGCGGAHDDRPATYPVSGTVTMGGDPVQGATVNFQAADGSCTDLAVDLSETETYEVVTNDFMANGGDGYPNFSALMVTRDIMANDVILWIGDNSPISPAIQDRIVCTDSNPAAAPNCPTVLP
jgi:uncharacterized protein